MERERRWGTACSHQPGGEREWLGQHHQNQAGRSGSGSWVTHLRRSLALSEAREALQVLSSGLLRAVGRVWSSTVRSLPCFHSSYRSGCRMRTNTSMEILTMSFRHVHCRGQGTSAEPVAG